ncbi:MAG: serine/threonine-protein kinase [Betaproteobacteria bacterium]
MPTPVQSLPDGHLINEYVIDKLVGVGGFGLTYLATDQNLNLPVALKEYFPTDIAKRGGESDDDTSIRPTPDTNRETFQWGLTRFLDEARTLATFRHPNIVRVMRFFQANSTAYMVMEYVQGASLSDWMRTRRPLPQAAIERIALPLIDGLGTIHRTSYLHRDVKPSNIYIREDGSPVLLDFGSARSTSGGRDLTAIVSPGYAPVEQYSESSAQGPWTDLYAMGGVMYWMVTGKKPVDATARLKNDPQPRAADIGDPTLYSNEFLQSIDWALRPDELERPQSSEEFLTRLRNVAASPSQSVAASETQSYLDLDRTQPLGSPTATPYTRTVPAGQEQPSSVPIDTAKLKEIESELAKFIGPLAAVLVRKAAKNSGSIEAVVETVAREIDDDDDRNTFSLRMKETTRPPASRLSGEDRSEIPTQLAAARFGIDTLERAEKRLAQHIGAIARVIVKKAAMRARDEGELYLIIADEIEDQADRKAFIKKAISASKKV